ncbi:MAG TPA: hypothetical protein PK264_08290, partial [Hyphomicrobiaceae bacterium]|nr:hypothetical protein [Hyphomicrobiaceae bacterium]
MLAIDEVRARQLLEVPQERHIALRKSIAEIERRLASAGSRHAARRQDLAALLGDGAMPAPDAADRLAATIATLSAEHELSAAEIGRIDGELERDVRAREKATAIEAEIAA